MLSFLSPNRLVYKWFYFIYKLSYGLGIVGYIVMMLTFLGFNLIFNQQPHVWMDIGLMFVFYGLYFGVLARDISEICADKMAANIGVSKSLVTIFTQWMNQIFIFVYNSSTTRHKVFLIVA